MEAHSNTDIEATEHHSASHLDDSILGSSASTVQASGHRTTETTASFVAIDLNEDSRSEDCLKEGVSNCNHSSGGTPPSDGPKVLVDEYGRSSSNGRDVQHITDIDVQGIESSIRTGKQAQKNKQPSLYFIHGLLACLTKLVRQSSYSGAQEAGVGVNNQPMERSQVPLDRTKTKENSRVVLSRYTAMDSKLGDPQECSPESGLNMDSPEPSSSPSTEEYYCRTHSLVPGDDPLFQTNPLNSGNSYLVADWTQHQREWNSEIGFPTKTEPETILKRINETDSGNSRSIKRSKKAEEVVELNQRSLACPFYKHDSNKYHDCRHNMLKRIKDVKQHVVRKHKKPDFYCPICFSKFKEANARDTHIQERQCTAERNPIYDGISEDQKKELSQYSSRGKSIEEQWNDTWRIIFPKIGPPTSPYLGTDQEEMVSLIRKFWDEKQDKIISSAFKTQPLIDGHTPYVTSLMKTILDLFEAEASEWTPPQGSLSYYESGPSASESTDWSLGLYPTDPKIPGEFIPPSSLDTPYTNLMNPEQLVNITFDEVMGWTNSEWPQSDLLSGMNIEG